jgi:hypothetical protein
MNLDKPKYDYEIILPDPTTSLPEYYIVRGKAVTKEQFLDIQFKDMLIGIDCYTHVVKLTPEEILKRYSDTLSPEQIETIKNHGKEEKQKL